MHLSKPLPAEVLGTVSLEQADSPAWAEHS